MDSSSSLLDLRPTTAVLADLIRHVTDDQLADRTPCPAYSVGELVDHIGGLAVAFTSAARKDSTEGHAPSADATRLEPGFRDRIARSLAELGDAWLDPAAYDGVTMAGPVELPADQAALVALDEVTIHAWDLAVATGQPYPADPRAVEACRAFVTAFQPPPDAPASDDTDGGLFGPPLDVPPDAPPLHQLLAAAGRDPAWTPPD